MCGRFVGFTGLSALQAQFPIDVANVEVAANYNVAPTQEILAIARYKGKNHLVRFHWGLVPSWAKDPSMGARLINARSETVAVKPSFRSAFRKRRCLIPSNGFYEWKRTNGKRQPVFLTLPDGMPFAFAGLWEIWRDGETEVSYRSCAILTREASDAVRPVHHRMPVILQPSAYDQWLDPQHQDLESLHEIIHKRIHTDLVCTPVSDRVNSVRNNGLQNIAPVEPG